MSRQPLSSEKVTSRTRLPPGQQLVAPGKWPYVGERTPADSTRPWTLTVSGLAGDPKTCGLSELAGLPQSELITDIHCVTRWSKYDARFSGVLLRDLLDACQPMPSAKFVSFVARSDRNHSSSLPIDVAIQLGTLLATGYDELPLPVDHGGPLRGVVPGKYFYKSVKWIERIELLEKDRPGYWESESGYHNQADPWQEQRYIAASVSKRDAAKLIETRNFSGQDLLSIDVASQDLQNLIANDTLLRNANFQNCNLQNSSFRKANLSNASFREADLRNSDLEDADLEGADFSSADLRGANFAGCSLFGTTFCEATTDSINHAAKLDSETRFDRDSLQSLSDVQRDFLERWRRSI